MNHHTFHCTPYLNLSILHSPLHSISQLVYIPCLNQYTIHVSEGHQRVLCPAPELSCSIHCTACGNCTAGQVATESLMHPFKHLFACFAGNMPHTYAAVSNMCIVWCTDVEWGRGQRWLVEGRGRGEEQKGKRCQGGVMTGWSGVYRRLYLVSIDLRELAVVVNLFTKSWLHRDLRPPRWLALLV